MLSSRAPRTGAPNRMGAWVALLALALTTVVGLVGVGTSPAAAAPPYTTQATITAVDFTEDTVMSGADARVTAQWSLPDFAPTPAGVLLELPPELWGRQDAFPLLDGEVEMGQCRVTGTQVWCDLDSAYLEANPRSVGGDVTFWVNVRERVQEEQEVSYDFGGVPGTVTVQPPRGCGTPCDGSRPSSKWGVYNKLQGTIRWNVVVAAPATGMAGGQTVTVVDEIGPGQTITAARVRLSNELGTNADGRVVPINNRFLDADAYTVSDDLTTVSFESQEGYFYAVEFDSTVTDGGVSTTYGNEAAVTVAGELDAVVPGEVRGEGGAATGSGTDDGTFTITKDVVGDVEAAAGLTYSGTYTVLTPTDEELTGTFSFADGETWTSPELPRGSTVHLEEADPVGPDNLAWTPTFSSNDFTLGSDEVTDVLLTNEVALRTGTFTLQKVIEGAAADLVPDGTTFEVAWSYPAGGNFPGAEGVLEVPADGTVVTSGDLPLGAEVTLTEIAPQPIEGLVWGTPSFSPSTFTIDAEGTATAVTLVNTAAVPPQTGGAAPPVEAPPVETPPTAAPPAVQGAPPLVATGVEAGQLAIVAAGLLVAGSAMVLVRARRRHARSEG